MAGASVDTVCCYHCDCLSLVIDVDEDVGPIELTVQEGIMNEECWGIKVKGKKKKKCQQKLLA